MSLFHWGLNLPTEQERSFAAVALGNALAIGDAQKMGESPRGIVRFGGASAMLAAMRDLVNGLRKVVDA